MNNIQLFNSPEFGQIRTITDNDGIYFVGKDVAQALGYSNQRDALARHVDDEDKGVVKRDTPGGVQDLTTINESGLYSLVLSSKLPSAKRFKRWVTSEVLPALRRQGGYMLANANETPEQIMARALKIADEALKRKDALIEEMKPKAMFADAVGASDNTCLVGELAKMLRQNGVDIGANRLFKRLRNEGFLGKYGSNYNVPTQRAMELGLFRIKETTIQHSDGHVTLQRTPKCTGKGQCYFMKRYASQS
ncbi:phage antirepressor KilAC domain-containing protein [Fannyhessea vaginae]|uniref:phage antirepressor KilAC domain-containing protein n=1 Tax=Fannyhessea vaginae TaxID=82135 RepID=UPI003A80467A